MESEIEEPREGSIVGRTISSGQCVVVNDLTNLAGFHRTADAKTGFVIRSALCPPIKGVTSGRVTSAVEVLNNHRLPGFDEQDTDLIEQISSYLSLALDNILISEETSSLSGEPNREMARFESDFLRIIPFIAQSDAMREVLALVRIVCDTPVNVLIQGENGTGKEVITRMIHEGRDRRYRSFVPVNPSAIPEHLMESEFFEYEKGAFTGAGAARPGRFEEAKGGRLFLDEVADISLSMQPKFLKAIQENEGSRLGANRLIRCDASVINATNQNLCELVNS